MMHGPINIRSINTGSNFGADTASYPVPTVDLFQLDGAQGAQVEKVFSLRYELK